MNKENCKKGVSAKTKDILANKRFANRGSSNKRMLLIGGIMLGIGICAALLCFKLFDGEKAVAFEVVEENSIPHEITSEIIPEYRDLERALACIIDDDVYVIVTRGEKPTSGFGVAIDRMMIEEEKDKKNLIVYAEFDDPVKKTAISQIITYPIQVVKTDLATLPDEIELRIQY